jgi:hypothetical protein
MRFIMFLAIGVLLTAGAPATAHEDCCGGGDCCASGDCCAATPQAQYDIVVPSTERLPAPEAAPAAVREYAEIMFMNPVWVNGKVLMGRYIIEHDNERMAKGGPCTHLYAASDRETPAVTFHCTHLIRPEVTRNTVTLRRDYNALANGYILTEFQFAGSRDAHGVPGVPGVDPVR